VQKIFYLHVPLAIVALCGLVAGAAMAGVYLRRGDRVCDARSYVAIHTSLIIGMGALITGSVWAKASWGHWWVWQEPTLVSFLIILLLFCCYQPPRFAIEDPERQSRYAAVFALTAGAFIPINFIAVRMASPFTHPRVFEVTGAHLPLSMGLTFLAGLLAVAMLYGTLCRFELRAKRVRAGLKALERSLDSGSDRLPLKPSRGVPALPPRPAERAGADQPRGPVPARSF
jgi:heme exporter protein C